MPAETLLSANSFGYLICDEDETVGFVGGLLVVNKHARPIEFHCTIPCRPTAAQRVLYGATLKPHLLTEQIPSTLFAKLKTKPDVILVNDLSLIELRERTETAIGCLHSIEPGSGQANTERSVQHDAGMTIGKNLFLKNDVSDFAIHHQFADDAVIVRAALKQISTAVEVEEPLERLRIAIDETCKPNSNAA